MESWKCKKCGRPICKCRRVLGKVYCSRCEEGLMKGQTGIAAALSKLLDCCKE